MNFNIIIILMLIQVRVVIGPRIIVWSVFLNPLSRQPRFLVVCRVTALTTPPRQRISFAAHDDVSRHDILVTARTLSHPLFFTLSVFTPALALSYIVIDIISPFRRDSLLIHRRLIDPSVRRQSISSFACRPRLVILTSARSTSWQHWIVWTDSCASPPNAGGFVDDRSLAPRA